MKALRWLTRPAGRTTAGVVYVEYIIAIVPMLTLFWGLMQLNGLFLADLVARHAVVNAVRAAIVCDSDAKPQNEGALESSNGGGCSYEAAKATLTAVKSFAPPGGSDPEFTVHVDGASTDGNAPVTVTLNATYHCQVPLVAGFVCGLAGGGNYATATLTRKATLPNQGAGYSFTSSSSTQ